MGKIKTRDEIREIVEGLKRKNKKIGFTSGSFDILHAGHVDYLEKAKQKCDVLIVGVNSDSSIKQYKDPSRPIISQQHRIRMIAALISVDYAFLFDETNNNTNIEILKPDYYIKAGDYSLSQLSSKPIVEKYGGEVILISIKEEISTTGIINRIKMLSSLDAIGGSKSEEKIKAVLLDRDGTINEEVEYLHSPDQFKFTPNALEGMKKMQSLGCKLMIVTNQPGIGLGYFTKEDFFKVNLHMFKQLSQQIIQIDKIYFCPHTVAENCECRKPKIGLIERAQLYYGGRIDMKNSFFIGDSTSDIKCGRNAGTKTILVLTGKAGKDGKDNVKPDFTASDLLEAARIIEENP
ncbi:HAD-IIIA family hydrolase [Candidatus Woesearchaeota archaeon]|nr:HAD-IIIA family hydrolase [Candidatus Woesearchaeota archaeon]